MGIADHPALMAFFQKLRIFCILAREHGLILKISEVPGAVMGAAYEEDEIHFSVSFAADNFGTYTLFSRSGTGFDSYPGNWDFLMDKVLDFFGRSSARDFVGVPKGIKVTSIEGFIGRKREV